MEFERNKLNIRDEQQWLETWRLQPVTDHTWYYDRTEGLINCGSCLLVWLALAKFYWQHLSIPHCTRIVFELVLSLDSCFFFSQTEPVNPSASEPERQSPTTQQCREEEGQVGESTEQTGTLCCYGHTDRSTRVNHTVIWCLINLHAHESIS